MVTWNGKDYPLSGFTVLQVLQFSNRLHIENPRPTQERKNYMERVVRFLGNMLLKCQNRTLTNLVLHDLSVSDISTIYMARSIPCIRQHTYNSMVDTEHAIWERVILFVGKCLGHDQDNQSETVKNLCEVMRGAKHETPVPEDTYNQELMLLSICHGCPIFGWASNADF